VSPGEAGNKLVVDLNWDVPLQDYDLKLYHVAADGSLQPAGFGTGATGGSAGSSGEANGVPEQIEVDNAAAGDYVARVIYYVTGAPQIPQANDWHMAVTRYAHQADKVQTGKEFWTMTCTTPAGKVLESQELYVERGQTLTADFGCGAAVPGGGSQPASGPQPAGSVLGEKKRSAGKKPSRRATCLKRASKVRPRARRRAAIKRCNRRYPRHAKTHAGK
jgi:hypothetical protein